MKGSVNNDSSTTYIFRSGFPANMEIPKAIIAGSIIHDVSAGGVPFECLINVSKKNNARRESK